MVHCELNLFFSSEVKHTEIESLACLIIKLTLGLKCCSISVFCCFILVFLSVEAPKLAVKLELELENEAKPPDLFSFP